MANNQQLYAGAQPTDPVASYAYTSTTLVFPMVSSQGQIHLIFSSATITPSSIVLAKAPNGSICINLVAGGVVIWIKDIGSGFGAINGTWRYSSTLT